VAIHHGAAVPPHERAGNAPRAADDYVIGTTRPAAAVVVRREEVVIAVPLDEKGRLDGTRRVFRNRPRCEGKDLLVVLRRLSGSWIERKHFQAAPETAER